MTDNELSSDRQPCNPIAHVSIGYFLVDEVYVNLGCLTIENPMEYVIDIYNFTG